MRVTHTVALLTLTLLVLAAVTPCAELTCSSACCDEVAPTQQLTAAIQPALPIPVSHSTCALPAEVDTACLCITLSQTATTPVFGGLTSRLRI